MRHASSWLGYSWDLVDQVHWDASTGRGARRGGMEGGRVVVVASRKERFRSNAGPSREQLHWFQILSILRKVRVPSILMSNISPTPQFTGNPEPSWSTRLRPGTSSSELAGSRSTNRGVEWQRGLCCSSGEDNWTNGTPVQKDGFRTESPVADDESSPVDEGSESKWKSMLQGVSWPFTAVGEMISSSPIDIEWGEIPESADPMLGGGYKDACSVGRVGNGTPEAESNGIEADSGDEDGKEGGHCEQGDKRMARGERKRWQVEKIAAALRSFHLKAGARVVDFGCGSGALTLPLAALFPEMHFVGVDFKQHSIVLLQQRARKANLRNVRAVYGRIENYPESFDACVALHACGIATDLALLQAMKHRAGYVMSPCCIGKLQIPIHFQLTSTDSGHPRKNTSSPAGKEVPHRTGEVPTRSSSGHGDEQRGKLVSSLPETGGVRDEGCENCGEFSLGDRTGNVSSKLAYPRSRWLHSCVSEGEFQTLARAADWSSYDHESFASRLHSLCKVVLELDRNEAAREVGYWTSLYTLSNKRAGTVGVSHVLVGKPSQ